MSHSTANDEEIDPRLRELLTRAYPGPDCPPPEAWLPDAPLTSEERERLEAHTRVCPACAAERELALAFAADEAENKDAQLSRDTDAIVRRLRDHAPWRARAARPSAPRELRSSLRWRRRSFPTVPLALAAGIVLTLGVVLRVVGPNAPPLGAPGTGAVMRGGDIETTTPAGEVASVPVDLRWREVPGAASYRVSVVGVDGEPVWSATVAGPPAELPESVAATMHASVLYRWQVEAMDGNGARIAWSKPTQFRIESAPQPGARD
jgi:hypothetical protein